MSYPLSHIAQVIGAEARIAEDILIEHLLTDSRRIHSPAHSLFFALQGPRRDGHQFIAELYKKGIRAFVISEEIDISTYPEAGFLRVSDTLRALQDLAAYHRSRFSIPVIGITGSNGKTIVKEWLYQLLQKDFHIVRSPKSYNSQIGVALSVWQMRKEHSLAIFEAGISEPGEMARLEKMIRPTIGVLTNIGEAHSEGFTDNDHKFREKMSLFKGSSVVIGREEEFADRPGLREILDMFGALKPLSWGENIDTNEFITKIGGREKQQTLFMVNDQPVRIPFIDEASVENAITCFCVLLELNIPKEIIAERMLHLHPVNMRLELKKGINHCSVINDSYSADLSSLEIALNFLDQQSGGDKKTVILSDFLQSALPDRELYNYIVESLLKHRVTRLIGIGERISSAVMPAEGLIMELYPSTRDFIQQFRSSQFKEETILVKGARTFGFEQIVPLLEQKVHQTVLEINLNAITHNLKEYQRVLKPSTKVMAMVKAFAYGSGGAEIAGILQYHKVDYLGVAYADEGVELRKAGITLPVMVMNPEESAFELITEHDLEPELYSFGMMDAFGQFLQQQGIDQYPVHIEIETGMNRLGFAVTDMETLGSRLNAVSSFRVQSVFSHLAASEEAVQDAFTLRQYELFTSAANELEKYLGYPFLKHIANSAGASRHPQMQMDMVRLGIGLYGVDNSGKLNLQTVATLRSTIAQLKQLKKGESVSYNRRAIMEKDSLIATIRMGYADGYPRRLGNGIGKIWVKGQLVPVTGTVCMDMFMADMSQVPGVQEGDDVIIFGEQLPVQTLAEWAGTIPYEIMTGISQRVKRVYFEE